MTPYRLEELLHIITAVAWGCSLTVLVTMVAYGLYRRLLPSALPHHKRFIWTAGIAAYLETATVLGGREAFNWMFPAFLTACTAGAAYRLYRALRNRASTKRNAFNWAAAFAVSLWATVYLFKQLPWMFDLDILARQDTTVVKLCLAVLMLCAAGAYGIHSMVIAISEPFRRHVTVSLLIFLSLSLTLHISITYWKLTQPLPRSPGLIEFAFRGSPPLYRLLHIVPTFIPKTPQP